MEEKFHMGFTLLMSTQSTTREDYELHYRVLRLHGVHLDDIYAAHYNPDLISSKALKSVEASDTQFAGWINRHRMHQFRVLRSGLFIRGELPF